MIMNINIKIILIIKLWKIMKQLNINIMKMK